MGVSTIVLVPLIRVALFFGCRLTILPWLFGEARHASLDVQDGTEEGNRLNGSLPAPATSYLDDGTSSSSHSLNSALSLKGIKAQLTGSSTGASPSLLSRSPSSLSALLLAWSFEESTILFALVLMEAMGFDSFSLRSHWNWSLFGVVALAICLIPLGLSILLTYPLLPQASSSTASGSGLLKRSILALIPFIAWLVIFLKVPLPAALMTVQTTLLESGLARTAVVGVTLIALLSGSGAMGAAVDSYETCAPLHGRGRRSTVREPSASDIRSAQASFQKACQDLNRTKSEVERLQNQQTSDQPLQSSWFSSIDNVFRGTPKDREIKALQLEISSLSMLAGAMRDELDTLQQKRKESQWKNSLGGRIWIVIGHAFALYCVMRLGVSLFSLLFLNYSTSSSSSSPDLISTLLAKFIHFLFSTEIDVSIWSKQISLLFVGLLILGRLRIIFNYLAQFFRAASNGISTSFLILFLAEILSVYLLATLIQLRTSLPPSFAAAPPQSQGEQVQAGQIQNDSHASQNQQPPLLATLPDFNIVFGALFDATFLLSATATLVLRFFWASQENESILFGSSSMRD
ncbi:unnamed protein product [Sympodiomycopsis kandeliae]